MSGMSRSVTIESYGALLELFDGRPPVDRLVHLVAQPIERAAETFANQIVVFDQQYTTHEATLLLAVSRSTVSSRRLRSMGLVRVVVDARGAGALLVATHGQRGQRDDGDRARGGIGAQLARGAEAVLLRHRQVHQDEGRVVQARQRNPFFAIARLQHGLPAPFQHRTHQLAVEVVIVDHQDRSGPAWAVAAVGRTRAQRPVQHAQQLGPDHVTFAGHAQHVRAQPLDLVGLQIAPGQDQDRGAAGARVARQLFDQAQSPRGQADPGRPPARRGDPRARRPARFAPAARC